MEHKENKFLNMILIFLIVIIMTLFIIFLYNNNNNTCSGFGKKSGKGIIGDLPSFYPRNRINYVTSADASEIKADLYDNRAPEEDRRTQSTNLPYPIPLRF